MIALNMQPVEKQVNRDDGALEIVDLWHTIQGEGPYAGRPAIFIRTAGCDLQCPACDTDYTTNRKLMPVDEIMTEIMSMRFISRTNLIVITGGEPFRQACGKFVSRLARENFTVQFETNGTLYDKSMGPWYSYCTLVCSPKTAMLNATLMRNITCLKYILKAGEVDPNDGLPTSSLNNGVRPCRPWMGFTGDVYVQPLDEQDAALNQANTQAAVKSCMDFGYILCLQTHKIAGLR